MPPEPFRGCLKVAVEVFCGIVGALSEVFMNRYGTSIGTIKGSLKSFPSCHLGEKLKFRLEVSGSGLRCSSTCYMGVSENRDRNIVP